MPSLDLSAMRAHNTTATLKALHEVSPMTLAQLKQATGLSRRALDLILEPLIDQEWVISTEANELSGRAAGRPARTYQFNYAAARMLAVQLDVHSITAIVADLGANQLTEAHLVTGDERGTASRAERLQNVYECVDSALKSANATLDSIMVATLSTPGIVRDDNTVERALSFEEWSEFSLATELEAHLSCPVHVENDAKLAAVGELWAGIGQGSENLVWVRADGVRFGIGIIVNGKLYRGNNGAAGEVAWASGLGLKSVTSNIMSGLADLSHPLHDLAVDTVRRARQNDHSALQDVRDLADGLAPGLSTLAWILAPDTLVIGGSLGSIADLLIPILNETPQFQNLPGELVVAGSALGDHAVLSGALKKNLDTLDDILFTKTPLPLPLIAHALPENLRPSG